MILAGYFGGTRNPMAVRWPAQITPDATPRPQFHHCNDVVPTIYEVLGITPPRVVNGVAQESLDGVSFAYSFDDPSGRGTTQDPVLRDPRRPRHLPRGLDGVDRSVHASRGSEGLPPGILEWTPDKDTWELYNLEEDWSQANDLASEMPDKVERLKELFLIEAAKNNVLPIGGGLWIPLFHPELRPSPPYKEWTFFGDTVRVPEFSAPALGTRPNVVTIEAVIPADANGVLYKLGGFSGGLTCFVEDGILCYEYNLFEIQRTKIRAREKLPTGSVQLEIETNHPEPMPRGPLNVTLKVNGQVVAEDTVPITTPIAFTANECLDFGISLGSPVSLDYYDKAPFKFNGTIERAYVRYA